MFVRLKRLAFLWPTFQCSSIYSMSPCTYYSGKVPALEAKYEEAYANLS